jgi:septum formation protein
VATAPQLVLASTSPRRKELLALLGIPFEVVDPGFEEGSQHPDRLTGPSTAAEQARRFAEGKAAACAAQHRDSLVLACDTLIDLDGTVLGKPTSREEARATLRALRGREHFVHSAVSLRHERTALHSSGIETVRVRMRAASDDEVERYIARGEWVGKAGSYAIQGEGGTLIEAVHGDYPAVVGLPLRLVAHLVSRHVSLPIDVEHLYRSAPYTNWMRFSGR